jgi:hypothetical protein
MPLIGQVGNSKVHPLIFCAALSAVISVNLGTDTLAERHARALVAAPKPTEGWGGTAYGTGGRLYLVKPLKGNN